MRALILILLLGLSVGVVCYLAPWSGSSVSPDEVYRTAIDAADRGDAGALHAALRVLGSSEDYAVHASILQSITNMRGGRPDLALKQLLALPGDTPLQGDIQRFTGEALYWLNRLPEAELFFRAFAANNPDHPAGPRWLGIIYYDLGANDAAIGELSKAVELRPDDYGSHRLIGLMYHDFEKYTQAVAHYERVLELAPPKPLESEVRIELAQSLEALGQFDRALDILAPVSPTAESQIVAARCHWSTGRSAQARELLSSEPARGSDIREAYLLDSDMRVADGDLQGALEVLRKAVDSHPRDAECRYQLALILLQLGLEAEADAEMSVWEELQRLAGRLTELNQRAVSEPRNAEIRDELAEVCEELGKVELASMWREAAAACRSNSGMFQSEESDTH